MVASRYISFTFLDGEYNPAAILSKHWGYQQVWKILKLILFHGGNTADLYEDDCVLGTSVSHPNGIPSFFCLLHIFHIYIYIYYFKK